ncbi:hypothetical protein V5O48_016491 [Marasmius crinis-equi]|uniref:Uncharacterized protein n=1 Tax=Marasmius crinis-equi TaxID=585013 RepID=A0ABR3ERJ0_9AGAR
MSLTLGIQTLGALDAGQIGTSIILGPALCAKIPVLLHDLSSEQTNKGLAFAEKLFGEGRLETWLLSLREPGAQILPILDSGGGTEPQGHPSHQSKFNRYHPDYSSE